MRCRQRFVYCDSSFQHPWDKRKGNACDNSLTAVLSLHHIWKERERPSGHPPKAGDMPDKTKRMKAKGIYKKLIPLYESPATLVCIFAGAFLSLRRSLYLLAVGHGNNPRKLQTHRNFRWLYVCINHGRHNPIVLILYTFIYVHPRCCGGAKGRKCLLLCFMQY